MEGIGFNGGVDLREGVLLKEGVDFARTKGVSKSKCPKAAAWVSAYPYGKRPSAAMRRIAPPRMENPRKGRDVWTVGVTAPGRRVQPTGFRKISRTQARQEAGFRESTYQRRCTVRIGYTKPGQRFSRTGRLAAYFDKGRIDNTAYNTGLIGYLVRPEAAVDNNPDWERSTAFEPAYTYDGDSRIQLTPGLCSDIVGSDPIFKIVLSPEDQGVDIGLLAAGFMKVLEKKLGEPLRWFAVTHHNTAHAHVHIVVSRKGRKGLLRLPSTFVKVGARKAAMRILTRQKGRVNWDEELRTIASKAGEVGFCDMDRRILAMSREDPKYGRTIPQHALAAMDPKGYMEVVQRLRALKRRRIVDWIGPDSVGLRREGVWAIGRNLEQKVRKAEFSREFGMDLSDCIVDSVQGTKGAYRCSVVASKRPDEDDARILLVLMDEDGIRHIREEYIDEDLGDSMPEGPFDISKIREIMGRTRC